MRSYHVLKRGNRYHYVCRVPGDLSHLFPVSTIYRSLKTSNNRVARLLAATLEHTTQGVFMKLRSGHLDENSMKQLITSYLGEKLEVLEARLMHRAVSTAGSDKNRLKIINEFAPLAEKIDCISSLDPDQLGASSLSLGSDQLGIKAAERIEQLRAEIKSGVYHNGIEAVNLAKKCGRKLHKDDQQTLQQRLLRMEIRLADAERAFRQDIDFSVFEELKDFLVREKASIKPRFYLGDAVDDFLKKYDDKKCTALKNSIRAAKRETTFIIDTLGENAEMTEFNSKKAVEKLKKALEKKLKSTGDPLADKTISEHLKRLSSIVKTIIDKNELDVTNKITGTYATVGPAKKRATYGPSDLIKLAEALCSVPIVHYKKPRNDRFWIILIAILQGFRKSAIVDLMERHITVDEETKLPCFDLTLDIGPSDKPRNRCPIHPLLIKIGFIKWLNQTHTQFPQRKLFEDDPESFGQWWNGMKGGTGWNRVYITTDRKKTFHSFRHYYCTWTEELRIPTKERNEMSCHALRYVEDDVRSTHYLDRTQVKRMRQNQNMSIRKGKFLMRDLDWSRLEARAKELFTLE